MKTTLSITSFLMILGLMISCNPTETESPENTITDSTFNMVGYAQIGQGNLLGDGKENIPKQNLVVSDSISWNGLIRKMDSINNVSSNFTEKNIDFTNFVAIAVFDKIYTNGGHSIDITGINEDDTHTYVKVDKILKGDATNVMSQPFHIVKISKNNKLITFE